MATEVLDIVDVQGGYSSIDAVGTGSLAMCPFPVGE